jgi:hypothetical protein
MGPFFIIQTRIFMWHSNRFHWLWIAYLPWRFWHPRHVPCVMDDFGTLVPTDSIKALHFIKQD